MHWGMATRPLGWPFLLFTKANGQVHCAGSFPLLEDGSKKYGRGSLGAACMKGGPDWSMNRDMLSPRYTTHWDELPIAKAS